MLELAKLRVYYAIVLYIILSQEKLRQMRLSLLLEKKQKSMENLATIAASRIRSVILAFPC